MIFNRLGDRKWRGVPPRAGNANDFSISPGARRIVAHLARRTVGLGANQTPGWSELRLTGLGIEPELLSQLLEDERFRKVWDALPGENSNCPDAAQN
jgi:hypothetical protein